MSFCVEPMLCLGATMCPQFDWRTKKSKQLPSVDTVSQSASHGRVRDHQVPREGRPAARGAPADTIVYVLRTELMAIPD